MANFLVYSTTTGEILRYGSCQSGMEAAQAVHEAEVGLVDVIGVTDETHYVEQGPPVVVTEKPLSPASIDVDSIAAGNSQIATITDVPAGSLLLVNGVLQGTISDGEVEFSADAVGMYSLTLIHYRYLPAAFRVGVGMIEFAVAAEVEIGISAQTPLPIAVEAEVAIAAVQERTRRVEPAIESEVGVDAVRIIGIRVEPAVEVEIGQSTAYNLPEAVEVETGDDARVDHAVAADPAAETEVALDAAA